MNKVAIAFLTKDRVDLSKRTIKPLLQPDKFDLWWIDGSDTQAGEALPESYRALARREGHRNPIQAVRQNVKGGADTAVVYALTEMLKAGYEYVGICGESMCFFIPIGLAPHSLCSNEERLKDLSVGAVSARELC